MPLEFFKCWFIFLPSLMLVALNVESNGPQIVLKQSDFCVGVYYATVLVGTSAQSNSFSMCCYMQQAWQGKLCNEIYFRCAVITHLECSTHRFYAK